MTTTKWDEEKMWKSLTTYRVSEPDYKYRRQILIICISQEMNERDTEND